MKYVKIFPRKQNEIKPKLFNFSLSFSQVQKLPSASLIKVVLASLAYTPLHDGLALLFLINN